MAVMVPKRTEFDIVNGPSRMDLMLALFGYRESQGEPIYFEFSNLPSGQGKRLGVWLDGLFHYVTGVNPFHVWEFKGRLVNDSPINPNTHVDGVFNDDNREGWMKIH